MDNNSNKAPVSVTATVFHLNHKTGKIVTKRFNTKSKRGKAEALKCRQYIERHQLPHVLLRGDVALTGDIRSQILRLAEEKKNNETKKGIAEDHFNGGTPLTKEQRKAMKKK